MPIAPVHHWCDIARRVTSLPMPSDAASPEALSRPDAWLPRLLSVPINEFCQIDRTHEPRRLLSAQPEGSARQQSGRHAAARFLMTKSKYWGATLSSGMFASPNSARRPKNVLFMRVLESESIRVT